MPADSRSVSSSGVMLWALLAPVGVMIFQGARESLPWFFAYIVMTAVSGFFDYYLGTGQQHGVNMQTISVFFALTTDPGRFVRALMRHARLPPRIGYSLFAAMQLVPDLVGEAQQMRLARAMKSGRRLRRIPGPFELMSLVIPLLAFAIRRAGRTAIAMEARGLAPHAPRTIMNAPAFHGRDGVFVVVALGMLGLCGVAAVVI